MRQSDLEEVNHLRRMGIAEQDSGRYVAAAENYRRALEIIDRSLGRNHHEAIAILHNLALLCDVTGRSDEARTIRDAARAGVAEWIRS